MSRGYEVLAIKFDLRNPKSSLLQLMHEKRAEKSPSILTFYTEKGPRNVIIPGLGVNPEVMELSISIFGHVILDEKDYRVDINYFHKQLGGGGTIRCPIE